jgi:hypothetical protein
MSGKRRADVWWASVYCTCTASMKFPEYFVSEWNKHVASMAAIADRKAYSSWAETPTWGLLVPMGVSLARGCPS